MQIGDVIGDYKVIEVAGSGGMGAVYKIEHIISKRIEAMKLLPSGLSTDPEQVQRFEREIQVQARLHHPNITALYNALRDGRSIALVMEFVDGESLQRMLEAGPLPVPIAVDYASQVLSALAYAHDAGVIHRDVSPANIIITPDRTAKLTDFGLARSANDPQLTSSGVPVGSPWYMSPEQVRGVEVMDARTDIYAVGAVLYEMLTGGKLFDGDGAFEIMRAHTESVPPPPSSRNPEVSPAIDAVVAKALAKDAELRFQSAEEFRLALDKALKASQVAAPLSKAPRKARPAASGPGRFNPSAAAVGVAFASAAMLLAFFAAIRYLPRSAHAKVAAPVSQRVEVPAATPAPAAPVAEAKAPEPPAPVRALEGPVARVPEVPARVVRPVQTAAPTAPQTTPRVVVPPAREPQRSLVKPPERNYAIRVSGGEIEAPPPPSPAASHSAAATVHTLPEAAEAPVTQPAVVPTIPELEAATSGEGAVKPQKPSNRLVRAIGKINPFHKGSKDDPADPAKPPAKKD